MPHRLRDVIFHQKLISAPPDRSVQDACVAMSEGRVGALPILEGERLVGIFSERDLMSRVIVAGRDPKKTKVAEVMTRDVVTAGLDESVRDCLEKMQKAGCRHLPVIADERVLSMLSMRDLLRDELAEKDGEIKSLRAYLHQEPLADS